MYKTKTFCFLFTLITACDVSQAGQLGRLSFNDSESIAGPGSGSFAVGDELVLSVVQIAGTQAPPVSSLIVNSSNPAVLSFSALPDVVDGVVLFRGIAVSDGVADLEASDPLTGALIDRITLQVKTANDVSLGVPVLFGVAALPDPSGFSVISNGSVILSTQLQSLVGGIAEGLKGQIPGTATADAQFASVSTDGPLLLGQLVTIAGNNLGVGPVTFSGASLSKAFEVRVIALDTVTLSATINPDNVASLSSGTFTADMVFLDGSGSLLGEQYRFREDCVVNLQGSCNLEIEPFGDLAFFEVIKTGTVTVEVALLAADGGVLQSANFTFEALAP